MAAPCRYSASLFAADRRRCGGALSRVQCTGQNSQLLALVPRPSWEPEREKAPAFDVSRALCRPTGHCKQRGGTAVACIEHRSGELYFCHRLVRVTLLGLMQVYCTNDYRPLVGQVELSVRCVCLYITTKTCELKYHYRVDRIVWFALRPRRSCSKVMGKVDGPRMKTSRCDLE